MIFARLRRLHVFSIGLLIATSAWAVTPAMAEYKGAIVIDAATGKPLFEDNADFISPPASVTKLMTFLVVHDAIAARRLTLATPVTATALDQSMGGTQVNLAAGETFSVEELLYALMVESANDAAQALSHAAASDRTAFVALMNARAQSLGMRNTTFRSPHGLPPGSKNIADGDLTTPRDLAILSRELVLHTDVLRYASTRTRPFGAGARAEPLHMLNHNKLLGKVEGLDGLKTGYTRGAGFCLAATAQRGDKRIIVVTMGSPTSKGRDLRIAALVEQTFPLVPATSVFQGYTASPISSASAGSTSPVEAPPADVPSVKFTLPRQK
ncbi:MAG: D-alanyl-D-alanine carboxypeptidase [Rariglobus sp.]|jgi:D-alanyl-D-alanine carboxypeptidase (penicillin-binding protein 5/6)|nr:D-alanyl-D-alanine carboxypeptidase [Rariglobus sp.]